MFESAELGAAVSKSEYKRRVEPLRTRLLAAQRALAGTGMRFIVVVGGVEGSGKTELARRLSGWLDPRGLAIEAFWDPTDEEERRPEYWRFWNALPPAGRGAVFVASWYTRPIVERALKELGSGGFDQALDRINAFETMLVGENTVLVKLWLHLTKKEQNRRLEELESDPETAWRVTKRDWRFARKYDRFREISERALARTGTAAAPWTVVEATDRRHRDLAGGDALLAALEAGLARAKAPPPKTAPDRSKPPRPSVLTKLDLTLKLKDEDELERQIVRVGKLARRLGDEDRSLVVVLEGVDAAGKGGAVRRLLDAVDVRAARVHAVAAPTDEESARPYLWRFWRGVPRLGRVAIFDRSWYGRVLVERVEGFCAPEDWKRAYAELAAFEEELAEAGAILCKFWLQISREEQLRRFKSRVATPFKQHKITPDDWRNRAKWAAYEAAAVEMLERTSIPEVPWTLVEAEDKDWARAKVLRTVADRLEAELG